MNRRSFLYALAGIAATLRASGRVGAGPFINASVAVGYDQPGRAISDNFIGLSYESAVLASPEHLSPANLSLIGFLRGLGPGGVLAPGAEPILEEMRSISESYGLPFRIAETNSIFMEGQPGVSDAFGSALWGVEFMFQVAKAGGEGITFHTGDAKAYTPIGPGLSGRQAARPLYYGMLMFKEAARGAALLPARLAAPALNMAACATRAADGTLKVCLINKDLERGARVGIDAGRHFESASLLRLTAPSAEARTDVTFGGSAVDNFGHWSPRPPKVFPWRSDSSVEVPAVSAVIVQLSSR